MNASEVQDILSIHYGINNPRLSMIETNFSRKSLYRVMTKNTYYILTIFPQDTSGNATPDVEVLAFLEANHYPSARVIGNNDGKAQTMFNGQKVVLTTFVQGRALEGAIEELYLLGQALGRLHALDVAGATLPIARMLPKKELSWVKGKLKSVQEPMPSELNQRYEQLLGEIESFDLLDDLPRRLIHNDAHADNAIHTPDGRVVYIDWEGAGLGAPIIDLAFLLMTADKGAPWSPMPSPYPQRIEAILRGYREHYHPSEEELERLPAAMKFRLLVYGCSAFADMIKKGETKEEHYWQDKYQLVEHLAKVTTELLS